MTSVYVDSQLKEMSYFLDSVPYRCAEHLASRRSRAAIRYDHDVDQPADIDDCPSAGILRKDVYFYTALAALRAHTQPDSSRNDTKGRRMDAPYIERRGERRKVSIPVPLDRRVSERRTGIDVRMLDDDVTSGAALAALRQAGYLTAEAVAT